MDLNPSIILILSLFLLLISIIRLFFNLINPSCSKCKSRKIKPFSEIGKYEVKDYHKCIDCGNVDFVNSGPRPEYY